MNSAGCRSIPAAPASTASECAGRAGRNDLPACGNSGSGSDAARPAAVLVAVRGSETFGAGPYNPLELAVVGEVFPGRPFAGAIRSGQAVRIMTGAPLPNGTDAVLQAEDAEEVPGPPPRVRVTDAVPPGRHV